MEELALKPIEQLPSKIVFPTKYYQTEAEFSAKERQNARGYAARITSGTTTIYQVPVGYTLYITGITLNWWNSAVAGASSDYAAVIIDDAATSANVLVLMYYDKSISGSNSLSIPYNMPIKLHENQILALTMSSTAKSSASFTGWIENSI